MVILLDSIINNINSVKQNIKSHTSRDINIVLATKMVDKDTLYGLASKDTFVFGENRVQEFLSKYFSHPNVKWHFIGQLQSNKVKYIIDKVQLIHSLDRLSLAVEIDKQAKKHNKIMDVLIEINIAKETTKGGVAPEDILSFVKEIKGMNNIRIKGIMSVMPNVFDDELNKYYLQLNSLYDTISNAIGTKIEYLSVGMSGDYLKAIEHGSNMVRLGSIIFGERPRR